VVKGTVEKVVDIKPASVFLKGNPGEILEAVVTIIPSQKYSFSILGMETRGNESIKPMLIAPTEEKKFWQVKIKSTSDKVQNLHDMVTLKTDSQYKPILTIMVSVRFLEKKVPKS
jgi:hypothetical protein